jgi:3-dehydroquinate synthase
VSARIEVPLGERSYTIHVGAGLLNDAGALLKPFARGRVAVVTDDNVMTLYYPALEASLKKAGLNPTAITLPPGEQTKDFDGLERLIDSLLQSKIERGDLVVALGGGVIGDLAGFASGIYKRGVAVAQIPTTLLAQVDASIGGKTGIDTARGKNLVGLFHQPRVVITDTSVLSTLPAREMTGGYAEVAKYGLLGDATFFAWLEANAARALKGDAAALTHAVEQSCKMKAAIVSRDEREAPENDTRALLNLGHTFGHALEAATGYSQTLTHGEGVAIGCALAFALSAKMNLCPPADADRVRRHFESMALPTRIAQISGAPPSADELLAHMRHDKKSSGGQMTLILAKGIGRAFAARDVPSSELVSFLRNEAR